MGFLHACKFETEPDPANSSEGVTIEFKPEASRYSGNDSGEISPVQGVLFRSDPAVPNSCAVVLATPVWVFPLRHTSLQTNLV